MESVFELVLLAVGFIMLIKGADAFVDGAAGIAERMGIPQLVIGLTIVAMGTSAPEAAVSISAARKGDADITIGNILGSNIINVLIILGLSAIITPLTVAKSTIRYETPFVILVTFMLLGFGLDGSITLANGIFLWGTFLGYLTYLFIITGKQKKEKEISNTEELKEPVAVPKAAIYILVGLAFIILGSDLIVSSATDLARAFGISERFIGLTIVALGTSLPELVTSVTAARKGDADIAIGNIVGSNIFNILFVVGTTALIMPIPFSSRFVTDTLIAVGAMVLLLVCCLPKHRIGRVCGIVMVAAYVLYFWLVCL